MTTTISNAQRNALKDAKAGRLIPSVTAGRLLVAGLVEKADTGSGQRGYARVKITPAGEAALAG